MPATAIGNILSLKLKPWLDALIPAHCLACEEKINSDFFCSDCFGTLSLSPDQASFAYQGALKQVIQEAKFKPNEVKARRLSQFWLEQIKNGCLQFPFPETQFDGVCFVPLHWKRRLSRGFDVASIFALQVADFLNIPLKDWLVSKHLSAPLSASKSKAERFRLVENRYRMAQKYAGLKPETLLLVDDVTTSGATLNSAAETLRSHGHEIHNYALAKTL